MKDEEIVALFTERSENAIAQTEKQYGTYCRAVAYRILQNHDDAAECVNDAYLKAWNAIPPHKPSCLRTFLGKLTRNAAFDRYEQRTADKRGGGELPLVLEELEECLSAGQDAVLDSVVIRETIDRFLEALPLNERTAFVRRYWYAQSIGEIAKAQHITESHVKVMLHRCRLKLKEQLEKEGIAV